MHGSYEANKAMHDCDLMINIGARFDDRITGKIDEFSPNSKKVHIDIDPSSINKNVKVDLPIVGDVTEVITQYGAPGTLAFKLIGNASKLTKVKNLNTLHSNLINLKCMMIFKFIT